MKWKLNRPSKVAANVESNSLLSAATVDLRSRWGGVAWTPGCQASASFLNPLAAGRQRFNTVAVLNSCGLSCDPQAHDSPVTCDVWSKVYFFHSKTNPTERTLTPFLGSRAALDVGSTPMRSRRRYQHDADELRAREFGSGRFGEGGASVVTAGTGIRYAPVRGRGVDGGRGPEVTLR